MRRRLETFTRAALQALHGSRPTLRHAIAVTAGAAGAAIAIALMEVLADRTAIPLLFIPFATSIVLVMGSPEIEAAQPRALVGGHLVSTVVGLLVVKVTGPGVAAAAVAVGLAMVAMHLTRSFHPPAGIDPLVVVQQPILELPVGPGGGRRVPAGAAGLRLAQPLSPRRLAEAMVVSRLPVEHGLFRKPVPASGSCSIWRARARPPGYGESVPPAPA